MPNVNGVIVKGKSRMTQPGRSRRAIRRSENYNALREAGYTDEAARRARDFSTQKVNELIARSPKSIQQNPDEIVSRIAPWDSRQVQWAQWSREGFPPAVQDRIERANAQKGLASDAATGHAIVHDWFVNHEANPFSPSESDEDEFEDIVDDFEPDEDDPQQKYAKTLPVVPKT